MDLLEWAPPEELAHWVRDATDRLLAAVGDLGESVEEDPRWVGPYLEILNPPLWELGHVGWFAEELVHRRLHGRAGLSEDIDRFYDSAEVSHRSRWEMTLPTPRRTRDYVRRVGDSLAELVLDDGGLDMTAHFATYAVAHHDAHVEALTYTRQTLGLPAPFVSPRRSFDHDPSASGDVEVAGGPALLGGSRHQPFVMDNEKWAHRVRVEPFSMARTAVTMADFAEFVDDGGYGADRLWSTEGRTWRDEVGATHPVYWRGSPSSGWEHRSGEVWRPLDGDAHHPVHHVNWHEAQAWCAWADRRLPTEAEWEFAASTGPDGTKRWQFPWEAEFGDPVRAGSTEHDARAALDGRTGGVVDVTAFADGDGPWGHRQLFGNVWEWTDDAFEPYPNFEPDAYRENSEPWFGTRRVLRGGSWASRSRSVRATARNFFTPDRRDVFAGFRTCATER
ncbi:selenoneine synthase SenA [Ilumatobacter sp.]|uniref:selenoneine synthase SenA n=1 Tax=Ilumatobacter sp. TaxID=1967498 RepID=UPI003B52B485